MTLECIGQRAKEAEPILRVMTREEKDRVLLKAAELLVSEQEKILAANEKDMQAGQERGMKPGLLDRLKLTKERIAGMAEGLRQIAELPDPVGEVMKDWVPENGLHIRQVRVPLGVIGIIYEARPNVTADAFGLCFKTGNPVVLRGGSDAIHSNQAITEVLQKALAANGFPENSIQLLTDTSRETAAAFMKLNRYIDVLIPRGSAGLIATVVNNSTIPVIETGSGNCHIYVDEAADLEMAVNIVYNAKTQRIGVCNACESLVVHRKVQKTPFCRLLAKRLQEKNVELRGDEAAREAVADDAGYRGGLGNRVSGLHSFCEDWWIRWRRPLPISTAIIQATLRRLSQKIKQHAEKFLKEVDAAAVYVNASTRFTDGFEFGFGAEIGISTQKLHARGPMGLVALTSYKYEITGSGQVRG